MNFSNYLFTLAINRNDVLLTGEMVFADFITNFSFL